MSFFCLKAYGRSIGIGGPDPVLERARERLPPTYRLTAAPPERTWTVDHRRRNGWAVRVDDLGLSEHEDEPAATEALLSDLELWVAEHARRAVFIHAGCVVAGERAIVVPGYSLSGKTTLTAALVRAGAAYYSDEFAVLDHRGNVRPYPRPLSMRVRANITERIPAAELGGRVGRGPAPVGLIAALEYDADAGFAVEREMGSRAALQLVPHAIPALSRPRATLLAIQRASSTAIAVRGKRGDADDAASALLDLLLAGAA